MYRSRTQSTRGGRRLRRIGEVEGFLGNDCWRTRRNSWRRGCWRRSLTDGVLCSWFKSEAGGSLGDGFRHPLERRLKNHHQLKLNFMDIENILTTYMDKIICESICHLQNIDDHIWLMEDREELDLNHPL